VKNPNLTERHLLTNEVDVNLDVLRMTMLDRVACHVNSADVVTEDDGRGRKGVLELEKKLTKPTALSHGVSHGSVLGLGTGARHSGLAFRRPGHQVIAKVDTVARGGATSVRAACPVRIRVCGEGHSRRRVKLKPEVESAANVAQDPLDEVEMQFLRSMHVETCLLDSMSDVRTRERQVLKSTGKLQYSVASMTSGPSSADSLQRVSIGVAHGLHSIIPAR
jgi:hypothetical protein